MRRLAYEGGCGESPIGASSYRKAMGQTGKTELYAEELEVFAS